MDVPTTALCDAAVRSFSIDSIVRDLRSGSHALNGVIFQGSHYCSADAMAKEAQQGIEGCFGEDMKKKCSITGVLPRGVPLVQWYESSIAPEQRPYTVAFIPDESAAITPNVHGMHVVPQDAGQLCFSIYRQEPLEILAVYEQIACMVRRQYTGRPIVLDHSTMPVTHRNFIEALREKVAHEFSCVVSRHELGPDAQLSDVNLAIKNNGHGIPLFVQPRRSNLAKNNPLAIPQLQYVDVAHAYFKCSRHTPS